MIRFTKYRGEKMSTYTEKNKKTKNLIQTAFLTLLNDKPFEKVTVGDITKTAQINRGTFYLHYLDKFDLLDQMEIALFEHIGSYIDELQQNYSSLHTFNNAQEQLATALFSAIQQHVKQLKVFLSANGRAGFHLRFRDAFSAKVKANLREQENHFFSNNMPIDFFIAFITSAFLGLIEQWIQEDLQKSPEEMTKLYVAVIQYIKSN